MAASQVRTNGLLAQATGSACGFSWTFDVFDFAMRATAARDRPPPGIDVRETVASLTRPAFWVKKAPPLEIAEVRQLFVRSAPRRPTQPSSQMEHWLYAALRDGSEVILVGRLEQQAQALFLERTIEAYLGIAPDNAHF